MTVADALAKAASGLKKVSETPRLDAELLMAHALGTSRESLLLHRAKDDAPDSYETLLERRRAHEPVAYITGWRDFWTIALEVGPGVLIPRPDSETLMEAAVARFGEVGPNSVLDLGTGPGTLLLAALEHWPRATGVGIDRSAVALGYARRNAVRLGLQDRARLVESDWAKAEFGRFDLVLCNPPYVESGANLPAEVAAWEPAEALYGGPDGLASYRLLVHRLGDWMTAGGLACIELGAGQLQVVAPLFEAQGFMLSSRSDLRNVDRCLVVTRPE